MRKRIEQAITKQFTILGLTNIDYFVLVCLVSLGYALLPVVMLIFTVLGVGIFLYRVNRSGKRFYFQSLLVWYKLEKKMTIQQGEPLPKLFKDGE
ncbi:hypothetical protein IIA28_01210 [candidate division KSB1 bacterium]|nr:hypothetical protein [candidate division KSB1 bacterium]MCH8953926.1 hypothetical protein [candidate division KSB1 bacterium]